MSSPLTQIRPGESTAATEPRVVSLDGPNVDAVFEALSSATRRQMLEHLYEDPATPSELADATDTSLQNVHYHLEKLGEVDLVESVGTRYSEKGAEMSVFAPTSDPLVIVEGEDARSEMENKLKRMIGGFSAVFAGGVLAQFALGERISPGESSGDQVMLQTATDSANATPGLIEQIGNFLVEPGVMVLVGGLLALLVLEAVYRRQ
ncbi:ArsR family transcriptional regulator [Halodesulfurarchaeum formicicum]|uniref:ArsR family transcriptional regulator n=1 Tax=Halodesulfurarchaeum formicicum TaxID=1873524 RepID=A0A1D8S4X2_9EURY|nr:helix-turn-helix domain-containing protein [Halodesulfurarchaeum formicicum]AOW80395.1 ArsR family transcriptional regulator [Halodesulfurarchaeum formicicum]APE95731.1 ArsR family transcriptional regulator [Halodesulfurarchaeum formicicum]